MKITREEYLNALDIVEMYHRQFRDTHKPSTLTSIPDWVESNSCSRKLKNALYDIFYGRGFRGETYKEEFIEKVDPKTIWKLPSCGKKTVDEFIKLRGY